MRTSIDPGVYMIATTAIHKLGDLSRKEGSLCIVFEQDETSYFGNWVEGFGFINVLFPKETTRELTPEEIVFWNGKKVGINGSWQYTIHIK